MRKNEKALFVLCFMMLAGCSDDASGTGSGSGNQENGCASCTSEQECVNNTCVNKTDGKPGDSKPSDGTSDGDVQPDACGGRCTGDQTCVDGTCMLTCENKCGTETCCSDGERCDLVLGRCNAACADGSPRCAGDCCRADQVCAEDYGCAVKCSETQTLCLGGVFMGICCDQGTVCERGQCLEECTQADKRCGDLCCDANQVCLDNVCRIACDAETGTRCGKDGEFCCDNSTQTCLYQQCLPRGTACAKNNDCDFDEFCESSTATCVKTDDVPATCQVFPKFDTFSARHQWQWPQNLPGQKPTQYPDYYRVIVVPLVANMTDDNSDGVIDENDVPDVIFVSYHKNGGPDWQQPSVLRVLSGDDGREIASSAPRYWTYPIDAAVADIDNDGKPEIIAGTNNNRTYDASHSWATGEPDYIEALSVEPDETSPTKYTLKTKYQIEIPKSAKVYAPSIADLDGDGTPEIITNRGVISAVDGKFVWREGCANRDIGIRHAADLDNDGKMELVGASDIMDDHCSTLVAGGSGGNIAIADLMPYGEDAAETGELAPEIVHVISKLHEGAFEFWKTYKQTDADGKAVWKMERKWTAPIPINKPRAEAMYNKSNPSDPLDCDKVVSASPWNYKVHYCTSGGGNPVIADFNGDTIPDVGVAAGYYYIVYSNDGTPNGGKVLWADSGTQDVSSKATGSSVFDFEGDGKAEVVYADELKLRIYSGMGTGEDKDGDGYPDPEILWSVENYSATGWEYPVIADVDNDGSTEIILSSDLNKTMGVAAYEDPGGQWVRTRRIWNQHFYHVTNINENGTVPKHEQPNWLHPKLNNYRQNVQPGGVFNAPNLTAEALAIDTSACSSRTVTLNASISNQGSLGIKAGLSVKFYVKDVNGTGQNVLIGETSVPRILPPGASASASLTWNGKVTLDGAETDVKTPAQIYFVLDEPYDGKAFGEFVECIETDNTSAPVSSNLCVSVN